MRLKSIKSICHLAGKKALVRVDFNVPLQNGQILDDLRIKAVLPTIEYLINKKAKVILISHLGDPFKTLTNANQNVNKYGYKMRQQFRLVPIYKYLKRLKLPISFVDDCIGTKVQKAIDQMKPGEVILLENLRFHSGEKKNDLNFAKQLASLANIYINEAFSVSHRAHASVSAVTQFLPSYAGFLLEKEIKTLLKILESPKHPFVVLIGGAKISTKIGIIENLAKKADRILIGGALANNFFTAEGLEIGDSIYEKGMISIVKKILKNKNLVLPIDVKIKLNIKNKKPETQIKNIKISELNEFICKRALRKTRMFKILDIGPETIKLFSNYLKFAKMIVWNGPMGYTEERLFAKGTESVIKAILINKKAQIIIGGGETIAALKLKIKNYKLQKNLFVSTGGGAMLKFLEGKILPGLKPLFY